MTFNRTEINKAAGWVPPGIPSEIYGIPIDKETLGWHRYIAYETGVVPQRVEWRYPTHDRQPSDNLLVIYVTKEALKAEPLRVPPPKNSLDHRSPEIRAAEQFPYRRARDMTLAEFEQAVDEIVFVPFEVVLLDG